LSEVFSVRISAARNRLYVVFAGGMTAGEMAEALAEIDRAVLQLRPGFDMLADIKDLQQLPEDCLEGIRNTASMLVRSGLHRAVRVVGRAVQATAQFERATRVDGYGANLAFSQAEAEQLVDGPDDD
jgi:hypothetical protein